MGQPHGSTVPEEWRPLMLGDREVDHARLASELLSAPPAAADLRAALLCRWWRLPGTYLLSKNLTEALVAERHARGVVPIAVVRPSLVAAVAGEPYPGYVGNLAGPSGLMTAFALGFFNRGSPAWHPHHMMDSVPGDVAAGVVLAATAALAAGVRSREQLHGESPLDKVPSSSPPSPSSSLGLSSPPPVSCAEPSSGVKSRPLTPLTPSASEGFLATLVALPHEKVAAQLLARAAGEDSAASGGSSSYHNDEGKSTGGRACSGAGAARRKGKGAGGALSPAASPAANGSLDPPRTLLVFHAATNTVNPCMMGWSHEVAHNFYTAYGPKFRLMRSYDPTDRNYTPMPRIIAWKKRLTGFKVAAAAALLGCFGHKKAANRLRTGFAAWDYANDPSHDVTHFFSVRNVEALEAALPQQERAVLPLLWRGDWHPYFNTYMAAVHRLFLGLPVPPSTPALPHAFVHRPHVHMAEEDLPRVAGRAEPAGGGGGGGRRAGLAPVDIEG